MVMFSFTANFFLDTFTSILLDSARVFLVVMMRRLLSVVVVSFLLLYVTLFSFGSHNVHLHGGLVLDDLGGGKGGASSVVLSTASSSDFSPDYTWSTLFLITFTAIFLVAANELLVVVGEGGGGGLLVNFVSDTVEALGWLPQWLVKQ
jgi:hypothetical protein